MADKRPVKYSDPYWVNLASGAEKRAGITSGLLQSILLNGERTNADRVSDAGARTPFQIIPATRAGAIKKYGVDPYLNDENAAYVAALHLRDSLKANNGDIAAAAGEYHAGPNRDNWGPKTRAYIERVTAGMGDATPAAPKTTYERMQEAEQTKQGPTIADVYKRYKSGQMSEEQRKAFEADVESGRLMLPRGAMVSKPKSAAIVLPEEISRAYLTGQMTAEQKSSLEEDMQAGLVQLPTPKEYLAKESVEGLRADFGPAASLPSAFFAGVKKDANGVPLDVPKTVPILGDAGKVKQPAPTFGERLVGTGEAATSLITAIPSAIGGGVAGLQSIIESPFRGTFGTQEGVQDAEKKFIEGMRATTYQPRTQQGQQQLQTAGEVIMNTLPVMPAVTGIEGAISSAMPTVRATAGAAGQALRESPEAFALRQAQQVVSQQAGRAAQVVRELPTTIRENMPRMPFTSAPETPTPGTMGSVGAAGVSPTVQRLASAETMEHPFTFTKGRATQDAAQLAEEAQLAKNAEVGEPLRQVYADNLKAARLNFENWLEQTGAQAGEFQYGGKIEAGSAIEKAIRSEAAKSKAQYRTAFREAEQAGEMEAPVALQNTIDYLNSEPVTARTALIDYAKQAAVKSGVAEIGPNGELVALNVPLKNAVRWTQQVKKAVNRADSTDLAHSSQIVEQFNADTATAGGNLYRRANRMYKQHADKFVNNRLVADIIGTKKGGVERKIALENVFDRIVLRGTGEEVSNMRSLLRKGGEEGKQAFSEIQGGTLQYLRDQAMGPKRVAGEQEINVAALERAVKKLDESGKLDVLLGKANAQKVRDIASVSRDLFAELPAMAKVAPENPLTFFFDYALSLVAGSPVPIRYTGMKALNAIRNRKLAAKVRNAINWQQGSQF